MYRRQFYWLLPWLLLYAGTASTQSSQDGDSPKVKQVSSTATLVLAGASYVGGWKEPALPGYKVVNRGAGGEETHQVLARFDRDVIAAKPAAVMIWGHINNVHRSQPGAIETTKEKAKADYREMVQRARANGIDVILATEVTLSEAVGLTNRMMAFVNNLRGKQNYSAWVNEHTRDLNAWLRTYAKEQGLPLWDFEKVFDDGKGFRKLEYSSDDGTHISPAGYAALTTYAQAQLRQRV
jgi:lysophospholipase L1-like esterase